MSIKYLSAIMAATLAFSSSVWADVVINTTRVIYKEAAKEVNVRLTNEGPRPLLVQSWLDDGRATESPENIDLPFMITPPVSRIDAKKGQTLRISKMDASLPKDRESIYYLNVLEVPPKAKGEAAGNNKLQLAFRTRIKMFYRPEALTVKPQDAAGKVEWRAENGTLVAKNNSPYYLTFNMMKAGNNSAKPGMVAPFATEKFAFDNKTFKAATGTNLTYSYISDYGNDVEGTAVIK
ncbi:fimbria/pilus periplasmic chaperone [Citrobacter braakii]|uniref:fimbria/pilus periplasmic chaperone n=1 Tax=Citrobacter braakii TaxID=57706 RepID=UPI001A95586E|nr:fimbria/pilus periplasmic chaperone [Citrobacter braakii]